MTTDRRGFLWVAVICFVIAWILGSALFGGQTIATQISPDGKYKVTIEQVHAPQDLQLYSTLIATGAKKEIGVVATRDQDVFEFVISADSRTVAYRYGSTPTGRSFRANPPGRRRTT